MRNLCLNRKTCLGLKYNCSSVTRGDGTGEDIMSTHKKENIVNDKKVKLINSYLAKRNAFAARNMTSSDSLPWFRSCTVKSGIHSRHLFY